MTTLADLDAMDRAALAQLWSELIGGEVPACMSQPMQRRFLAFELQAKSEGGLPAVLRARLDRIAAGEERKASPTLQSGARLLREWNGTTHVVDVLPEGFLWNGSQHRSLSAIARAITGARWSGPRFFGLVGGAEGDDRKPAKGKVNTTKVRGIEGQRRARAA
ncbi:MAG: DUF2924 domain-containing protein [Fuscovulum sp.]|jgi:hypothetical protein|nr:MAG: DUF2924 domain-containing protein [Fuscovulum sp.]